MSVSYHEGPPCAALSCSKPTAFFGCHRPNVAPFGSEHMTMRPFSSASIGGSACPPSALTLVAEVSASSTLTRTPMTEGVPAGMPHTARSITAPAVRPSTRMSSPPGTPGISPYVQPRSSAKNAFAFAASAVIRLMKQKS